MPGNRSVGTEPLNGPVERAQKRSGRDRRVGRCELAASDAGRDQRADGALVAVASGDDRRAPTGGQGVELEVRRRTPHFLDQAAHVIGGQAAQPRSERSVALAGGRGVRKQAIERPVLTEVENLVLAAEVVIEVGGGEIRGHGDLAHAGGGKAHLLKHSRRGGEDCGAAGLGPLQSSSTRIGTAVRRSNHGSIVGESQGNVKRDPSREGLPL
jgi:hypothetical protein